MREDDVAVVCKLADARQDGNFNYGHFMKWLCPQPKPETEDTLEDESTEAFTVGVATAKGNTHSLEVQPHEPLAALLQRTAETLGIHQRSLVLTIDGGRRCSSAEGTKRPSLIGIRAGV